MIGVKFFQLLPQDLVSGVRYVELILSNAFDEVSAGGFLGLGQGFYTSTSHNSSGCSLLSKSILVAKFVI